MRTPQRSGPPRGGPPPSPTGRSGYTAARSARPAPTDPTGTATGKRAEKPGRSTSARSSRRWSFEFEVGLPPGAGSLGVATMRLHIH